MELGRALQSSLPFIITPASPAPSCHPPGPSETRSPWTAQDSPGPCPQPSPSASAPPVQRPACLVSPPSSWSRTGSPAPAAAQKRSSLHLGWSGGEWRKVGRRLGIRFSHYVLLCVCCICTFSCHSVSQLLLQSALRVLQLELMSTKRKGRKLGDQQLWEIGSPTIWTLTVHRPHILWMAQVASWCLKCFMRMWSSHHIGTSSSHISAASQMFAIQNRNVLIHHF